MKPNNEQIKEFWDRLKVKPIYKGMFYDDEISYPLIDLNNLFKYAVPKLLWWKMGYNSFGCWAEIGTKHIGEGFKVENMGYNPALALFWAIWEVMNEHTT